MPCLLPPAVQIETLNRLLHRDLSNPLHNTNLHLHHFVTYGMGHTIPIVHDAGAGGCRASKTNRPSFFAMNPSVKFAAKDPSIHRDITVKDVLEKKLRWVTLGGQYNWTAKRYPTEKPPPFPADIRQLIGQIFSDIDPQAAILSALRKQRRLGARCLVSLGALHPFSPGGRYLIDEAFCSAASVSSTVSKTVVWKELSAPPAPIASTVAAIETLSGASHKVYPS